MFKDKDGKWKHTEEEKEKARKESKKLIWYTNGVKNKRLKEGETPPEGFEVGRTITWKFTTEGTTQTEESNEKRRQKLLGRPSPNKGNPSPKKGMTELEYYKDPELVAKLAEARSKVHKGKKAWNEGLLYTIESIREGRTASKVILDKINKLDEREIVDERKLVTIRFDIWADSVKRRDKYICQHCGVNSVDTCHHCSRRAIIHAHHIKGWKHFPLLRFLIENGLTLCNSCHNKLELRMRSLRKLGPIEKTFSIANKVVCSICHRITSSDKEGIIPCSCSQIQEGGII